MAETNEADNQQGTLVKTLNRIKEKSPQCTELVDLLLVQANQGWDPQPNEFLTLIAQFQPARHLETQKKDLVVTFLSLCLKTDSPAFNAQVEAILPKK
jgi:hypothetical protein